MSAAIWAPLAAFASSLVIVWLLVQSRFSRLGLDHPNERSLHEAPVPRTGGIAIQGGIGAGWALVAPEIPIVLWLAWLALVAVSLCDDVRGLPVAVRLFIHVAAATAVTIASGVSAMGPIAMALSILSIAWMANLYNFMDGADGLAGGMALFGFSFLAIGAWFAGDAPFALASLTVAGAAGAFLLFNFPPARIFMGDAGSVPIGFLAAALGLAGSVRGHWDWWFPVVVFSPFVVDASVTLTRRLLRRDRVWRAHRDHYYQRLVQLGWGHRKTAWAEYVLMAGCGSAALALIDRPAHVQAATLIAIALVYGALAAAVGRAWKNHRRIAER